MWFFKLYSYLSLLSCGSLPTIYTNIDFLLEFPLSFLTYYPSAAASVLRSWVGLAFLLTMKMRGLLGFMPAQNNYIWWKMNRWTDEKMKRWKDENQCYFCGPGLILNGRSVPSFSCSIIASLDLPDSLGSSNNFLKQLTSMYLFLEWK
jgi:hypothetical protein